jgi:hypothetical protein
VKPPPGHKPDHDLTLTSEKQPEKFIEKPSFDNFVYLPSKKAPIYAPYFKKQ